MATLVKEGGSNDGLKVEHSTETPKCRSREYHHNHSYQKNDTNMIWTNIRGGKFSNIFEYPNIQHTMIWKIWYEQISEYIRIKKMIRTNIWIYSYKKKDTNMIRTNIRGRKYSNIFEYLNIRHTMFRNTMKLH